MTLDVHGGKILYSWWNLLLPTLPKQQCWGKCRHTYSQHVYGVKVFPESKYIPFDFYGNFAEIFASDFRNCIRCSNCIIMFMFTENTKTWKKKFKYFRYTFLKGKNGTKKWKNKQNNWKESRKNKNRLKLIWKIIDGQFLGKKFRPKHWLLKFLEG